MFRDLIAWKPKLLMDVSILAKYHIDYYIIKDVSEEGAHAICFNL